MIPNDEKDPVREFSQAHLSMLRPGEILDLALAIQRVFQREGAEGIRQLLGDEQKALTFARDLMARQGYGSRRPLSDALVKETLRMALAAVRHEKAVRLSVSNAAAAAPVSEPGGQAGPPPVGLPRKTFSAAAAQLLEKARAVLNETVAALQQPALPADALYWVPARAHRFDTGGSTPENTPKLKGTDVEGRLEWRLTEDENGLVDLYFKAAEAGDVYFAVAQVQRGAEPSLFKVPLKAARKEGLYVGHTHLGRVEHELVGEFRFVSTADAQ